MSERKPHMLHLTVLNPARHTRIFHKLGWSQVQQGWQVSVAGQDVANAPYRESGIQVIPMSPFSRLSWRRWSIRREFMRLAKELQPDAVTIHAPELLPLARRIHQATGARIWYDVHEDYAANIRHARYYPRWLRGWLARRVRSMERQAMASLWRVSYAEACYLDILDAGPKAMLLPNLFPAHLAHNTDTRAVPNQPYFLYGGTIAREWGVMATIDWWEQIHEFRPYPLVIAGYCAQPGFWAELQARIRQSPYSAHIRVIGGEEYVPYPQMIGLIQHCEAGFGLYEPLPHLAKKIPTKFYEFLALGKPLIYRESGFWSEFGQKHPLGVGVGKDTIAAGLIQSLDSWIPAKDRDRYEWRVDTVAIENQCG